MEIENITPTHREQPSGVGAAIDGSLQFLFSFPREALNDVQGPLLNDLAGTDLALWENTSSFYFTRYSGVPLR